MFHSIRKDKTKARTAIAESIKLMNRTFSKKFVETDPGVDAREEVIKLIMNS